jgi:hypothetical protein
MNPGSELRIRHPPPDRASAYMRQLPGRGIAHPVSQRLDQNFILMPTTPSSLPVIHRIY